MALTAAAYVIITPTANAVSVPTSPANLKPEGAASLPAASSSVFGDVRSFCSFRLTSTPAGAPRIPQCAASSSDHSESKAKSSERSAPSRRRVGRRQLINTAGSLLAIACCPLCGVSAASAAEWGYGQLSGPQEWGELCKTGTVQSPIDIPAGGPVLCKDNSLGALQFAYASATATYLNTGHGTMQVNFPAGSNFCEIAGRKLELLQYHFHAPSEHSFNGVRSAMEAHLVHRDGEGKLAVIGVMLEADRKAKRNLCLEAALAFAPEKVDKLYTPAECYTIPAAEEGGRGLLKCVKIQITPSRLVPLPDREDGTHSYIHYKGSLTTPPCSEGVDWFVIAQSLKIPDAQVVEFMSYVGERQTLAFNARPAQDLGDRVLISYT
eukprot:TRINITY_DN3542_c0_g1_i3.p1 TRINITY_DN3542_c0_g1~~TRINITY_DN3542_c0_g1_i3.p1  ORF type:complete len:380 (+),score=61.46 TRINITY_DN3542_c0_g1_i3:113-1252(+)